MKGRLAIDPEQIVHGAQPPSTCFFRFASPPSYTPVIRSIAALSFSPSGGVSDRLLRRKSPTQVTTVVPLPLCVSVIEET